MNQRRIYGALCLLMLMPFDVHAASKDGRVSVTIGSFREDEGDHAGVEVSGLVTGNYLAYRMSGMLFSNESSAKIKDVYGGFAVSGYVHLNQKYINPYVGVGAFIGETFNCSEQEEEQGDCREDKVLSAYPEAGIAIHIDNFHIFPFVRRYFDTNSHAGSATAFGLHIGFSGD